MGNIMSSNCRSRAVSTEQGEQKAKEYNMEFLETSAKSGLNIKSLFNRVVAQLGLQQPAQANPDGAYLFNSNSYQCGLLPITNLIRFSH